MTTAVHSGQYWPFIFSVVTVLLHGVHGQSYHFVIGHHQRSFDQLYRDPKSTTYVTETNFTSKSSDLDSNSNSTVIVVQSSVREVSNDLSQTTMDIITIVWYVATFLALAAFFLLMACSDRRCSDARRSNRLATNEPPIPPPTPSPSYSEFAPPSYDSVMKLQHANMTSIFVIPLSVDQSPKDGSMAALAAMPTIDVYTINELHKINS